MKRAILSVSAATLTVLLAAFGPPELPSEKSQQAPFKTWIPEPKTKDPLAAAPDLPKDETHAGPVLKCGTDQSVSWAVSVVRADPRFGAAYAPLDEAIREERYGDAAALVEKAAQLAGSAEEWTLVEQVRFTAYLELKDKFRALRSVDAALSLGCLSDLMATTYRQIHTDLQLGLPPG